MDVFTEDLKKEYFNALYNLQSGNNEPMKRFKNNHLELFNVVNAMYHKRKLIRQYLQTMEMVSFNGVVFGALTYDNEHNEEETPTKRKQAIRHLNKYLDMFLFIEELGTEHERYHIHFIGTLKPTITYNQFNESWHSRCQIEKVISKKRTINYLTDYVVKQVPRIRRNKKLIEVSRHIQKSNSWRNYGFNAFSKQEENNAIISLVFDL